MFGIPCLPYRFKIVVRGVQKLELCARRHHSTQRYKLAATDIQHQDVAVKPVLDGLLAQIDLLDGHISTSTEFQIVSLSFTFFGSLRLDSFK